MKAKILIWVFIIVFMVMVGYLQFRYDSHRQYDAAKEIFVTLPAGKTLSILSFGFRNLAADLLFIWSIQFYSTYNLTNSYDYLEQVYDTITDITPNYKEPYIVGSWIMALEAGDVRMAIRLLQKGARNMKGEWIFDYESGFYAYKNLKDYPLAEKFFSRASANPSAPPFIRRTRAHMVYMEDNLGYAYSLWMDIYKNAKDSFDRNSALNHLHQIKFEQDKKILAQQIARFKTLYRRYPYQLEELKQAGLVKEIPRDFDGNPYIYLPEKGTITAAKVLQWKKSF
jgi:hypothetical protein